MLALSHESQNCHYAITRVQNVPESQIDQHEQLVKSNNISTQGPQHFMVLCQPPGDIHTIKVTAMEQTAYVNK